MAKWCELAFSFGPFSSNFITMSFYPSHLFVLQIRSDPNLLRLATDAGAALALEPLELFRQLLLQPIGKLYGVEERRSRRRKASVGKKASIGADGHQRSPSRGSDYDSHCGGWSREIA
jgi:hypothetical protein